MKLSGIAPRKRPQLLEDQRPQTFHRTRNHQIRGLPVFIVTVPFAGSLGIRRNRMKKRRAIRSAQAESLVLRSDRLASESDPVLPVNLKGQRGRGPPPARL